MYYYSPSQNIFIPESLKQNYIDAGTFFEDAIEVDDEIWSEFSASLPPEGKIRKAGKKGLPEWVNIPPLTEQELAEQAAHDKSVKISQANQYINSRQWPGKAAIGRLKDAELKQYTLWLDYLEALELTNTSAATTIDWPVMPQV